MYYEDDSSCSEERYKPSPLEKLISKSMNTTKRGNVRYQIKSRKGEVKSEVNKEKENAERKC